MNSYTIIRTTVSYMVVDATSEEEALQIAEDSSWQEWEYLDGDGIEVKLNEK